MTPIGRLVKPRGKGGIQDLTFIDAGVQEWNLALPGRASIRLDDHPDRIPFDKHLTTVHIRSDRQVKPA